MSLAEKRVHITTSGAIPLAPMVETPSARVDANKGTADDTPLCGMLAAQ